MAQPPPAIAATRLSVRKALADLRVNDVVFVACSGGADSLALAAATVFEGAKARWRVGLVTVNHQLQPGADVQAERVALWARETGFAPVLVETVQVYGVGGPEAAARSARYAALSKIAIEHDAAAILLGHTREDQAETVLLALARGAGSKALSGMAPVRGVFRRPFLELPRELVRAAADGLPVWEDPHNTDPSYARSRVRALLPVLEKTIGGGVVASLARTAHRLRQDEEFLEALATARQNDLLDSSGSRLDAKALSSEPTAIRTRVLRLWALAGGVTAGSLAEAHIEALDALVCKWRGQGPVSLPGAVAARRRDAHLELFGLAGREPALD
ncbi:MAG: tRNA lysidine(34) synthetase TilS [Corynebacteriales bacterium]|nr:tRNA lysidine(34) synthetase TilS [Mycobacteriales bacterium]